MLREMWSIVQLIMCIFLACVVKSGAFVGMHRRGLSPALSTARQLAVGDHAPDFELKNAKGQSFRLSDYLGKKSVVVFFYPADNSPGCTQQVCAFQRKFPDFRAANAEVFGVSSGGVADKEKFIASNRVTSYELLIDEGDKVRKSWKVPRALFGVIPGRVTYVVDPAGKVVEIFDDLARAALHTDKALDAVRAAAKMNH